MNLCYLYPQIHTFANTHTHTKGNTLLHNACGLIDCVNVLKYLVSQDICQPMLLTPWSTEGTELLPVDIAQDLVVLRDSSTISVVNGKQTLGFVLRMLFFMQSNARSNLQAAMKTRKPSRQLIQDKQVRTCGCVWSICVMCDVCCAMYTLSLSYI